LSFGPYKQIDSINFISEGIFCFVLLSFLLILKEDLLAERAEKLEICLDIHFCKFPYLPLSTSFWSDLFFMFYSLQFYYSSSISLIKSLFTPNLDRYLHPIFNDHYSISFLKLDFISFFSPSYYASGTRIVDWVIECLDLIGTISYCFFEPSLALS